ncbi:MAG: exopolysaccharide biosynthesis polyprenyl glycosylphosphotransferase [Bryobacteraceae bacterium]|nr:exopolysaccharide biosynthesis polyprenyl glycosylphosphotransferase [Bryobacteraceae bacterium]
MIPYRVRGLQFLHGILQGVAALLLFWGWAALFFFLRMEQPTFGQDRYYIYCLLVAAAFAIDLLRSTDVRSSLLHLDVIQSHRLSIRQTTTIVGVLLFFLVAAKDQTISRVFLFTYASLLYLVLCLTNRYLPRFLAAFVFNRKREQRTILLGSTKSSAKLSDWLRRKASYGLQTIGLITDESNPPGEQSVPILGTYKETERILKETKATQLLVSELPMFLSKIGRLGTLCDKLGVRLLIVNDMEEKLQCSISFVEDDGFSFLSLRHEPLECPLNRLLKRLFDLVIALPVVLLVLPVTNLLVWLFQRAQSPGPLFFFQTRTGLQNRNFVIYKYRTMHDGNIDEALQASANDPRVYPAGRWLRRLSIDELPQFINVLKGDMSIVGPRPHFVDHEALFGQIATYYRVRSFIKPGITGLAQVRGLRGETRREVDLIDRIKSDVYYLENWSFFLDWFILLRTTRQMLMPPKTAY